MGVLLKCGFVAFASPKVLQTCLSKGQKTQNKISLIQCQNKRLYFFSQSGKTVTIHAPIMNTVFKTHFLFIKLTNHVQVFRC